MGELALGACFRFRASIEPELLEVRTGLLGKRLLIPVEQVAADRAQDTAGHPWRFTGRRGRTTIVRRVKRSGG
jgi:hypothetical protein